MDGNAHFEGAADVAVSFFCPKLSAGIFILKAAAFKVHVYFPLPVRCVEQGDNSVGVTVEAGPDSLLGGSSNLAVIGGTLIDSDNVAVGYELNFLGTVFPEFPSENQGGTEYGPEGHHGLLLVVGEVGIPVLFPVAALGFGDLSNGEHVAVGPAAWLYMVGPLLAAAEHGVKLVPLIPEIACHAPHVGVLRKVKSFAS